MNKKLKKEIENSFRFPQTKHKYEFLMRADVASAEDKKRKRSVPVYFRAAAAAAACIFAVGLWANLDRSDKISGNDFRGETTAATNTEATTVEPQHITTTALSDGLTAVTTARASETAAYTTNKTADKTGSTVNGQKASPALEAPGSASADRTVQGSRTATNEPCITTTTASSSDKSSDMKNISAFLSAITVSMTSLSSAPYADYAIDPARYSHLADHIEALEKDERVTDLNRDGVFDLTDCYLLSRYIEPGNSSGANGVSDEGSSYIAENADYNNNGRIDEDDRWILSDYYLLNNKISRKDIDPKTYDPDYVHGSVVVENPENTSSGYIFASELYKYADALLATYYLVEERIDNNDIDLDVDGNGIVNINDLTYLIIYGNNHGAYYIRINGTVVEEIRPNVISIPENIRSKCEAVFATDIYGEFRNNRFYSDTLSFIADYFILHMPMFPEYYDNSYYEDIIPYASEYCIGDQLDGCTKRLGLDPNYNRLLSFNAATFEKEFKNYYEGVLKGKEPVPDVNRDGVADHQDYLLSDSYLADIILDKNEKTTSLPSEIWDNITGSCDFNHNGISGDLYDIMTIQMYIIYTESDGTAESVSAKTKYSHSNISRRNNNNSKNNTETERSGDANCDGKVDLADALLIIQAITQPDKFQLSAQGRYNADVDDTGDGVTIQDAVAIQLKLLNGLIK